MVLITLLIQSESTAIKWQQFLWYLKCLKLHLFTFCITTIGKRVPRYKPPTWLHTFILKQTLTHVDQMQIYSLYASSIYANYY